LKNSNYSFKQGFKYSIEILNLSFISGLVVYLSGYVYC